MSEEVTTCGIIECDRPGDGYFVCAFHAEDLMKVCESTPWVLTELDLVMSLQTRYTSGESLGSGESAPMDFVAAKTRRDLESALINAAARIAHSNQWDMPISAKDAAAFLIYRITAVRLHPLSGELISSVFRTTKSAIFVIDRPVSRQYLGDCAVLSAETGVAPCPGRVYGREWRTWAACDTCGLRWDQRQLRAYLIAALSDRLCTASEIAKLSTYLGLTLSREQVRKRLNQWHRRGHLPSMGARDGAPVFRFGTAESLLSRYSDSAELTGRS